MSYFLHVQPAESGVPKRLYLRLEDARVRELHTLLSQALNTRPDAPKWLFDLCDSIDPVPVPTPHNARSKK